LSSSPTQFVDEGRVRRGFDRVAAHYDVHASIEREIGRRMLERLDYVRIDPQVVLDLGCGPGTAYSALRERYPKALIAGVDLSVKMLHASEQSQRQLRWLMPLLRRRQLQKICANAAVLPVRTACAQLVWSNLLLHWCDDAEAVIGEMHRVLEVGGLAMFTTFGPDTLKELRAAFADGKTHNQRFADLHDLGDMLVHAGFADPVMDMEMITLEYADANALFTDLRRTGAGNAMLDRAKGLSGRRRWQAMLARLDAMRRQGRLPMTLELVYGHAWKGAPKKTADERSVIHFVPRK
jgi:malonyl-CoA O-methyltransferase